jgi:hypothetical protein
MPAAASLARAALKLCIAGCIALFNYVVFGWRMEAFEEQLKAIYDNWGILYPYSGEKPGAMATLAPRLFSLAPCAMPAGSFEVETLDAEDSSMVALMWLPLLVAALATYLLIAIPHGTGVCQGFTLPRCMAYA